MNKMARLTMEKVTKQRFTLVNQQFVELGVT